MTLSISEILVKVAQAKTREEKVKILRENSSQQLAAVLKSAQDTSVKWKLPEGAPSYTPSQSVRLKTSFFNEIKKLYLFVGDQPDNIRPFKREALFKQILESIDKDDARLLIAIKDRKLPDDMKVDVDVVSEVYPGLIVTPEKEPTPVPKKEVKVKSHEQVQKTSI